MTNHIVGASQTDIEIEELKIDARAAGETFATLVAQRVRARASYTYVPEVDAGCDGPAVKLTAITCARSATVHGSELLSTTLLWGADLMPLLSRGQVEKIEQDLLAIEEGK